MNPEQPAGGELVDEQPRSSLIFFVAGAVCGLGLVYLVARATAKPCGCHEAAAQDEHQDAPTSSAPPADARANGHH